MRLQLQPLCKTESTKQIEFVITPRNPNHPQLKRQNLSKQRLRRVEVSQANPEQVDESHEHEDVAACLRQRVRFGGKDAQTALRHRSAAPVTNT